jgi:hypothetical protein
MPLPLPRLLLLREAAAYVAERCQVSIEKAQSALDRAFQEYSLSVFDEKLKSIQDLRGAKIDWINSAVIGGEYLTVNGIKYTARVQVFRRHLDEWMGKPASSAHTPPPSSASQTPTYNTGLSGKPTSWHLIEPECRRRYAAGERHQNESTGRESPTEWAKVLVLWLQSNHPAAAPVKPKTLASNKLPGLLRELQATAC